MLDLIVLQRFILLPTQLQPTFEVGCVVSRDDRTRSERLQALLLDRALLNRHAFDVMTAGKLRKQAHMKQWDSSHVA